MDTTVSLNSICEASIFSRVRFMVATSELQAGFARRVGHRLDAAVIEEPVPVEHHALHALLEQALRDRLADRLGAGHVAALGGGVERTLHRRLDRGGRRDRLAVGVVDHLDVDVRDAAEHGQARALSGAAHPLADAELDPFAAVFLRLDTHRYFAPVLPTFFFSTS